MKARDVRAHRLHQRLQLVQLVLGKRLGGEQVHRAGVGLRQAAVQHGQVVAECFAAGGRRDDDDVLAGFDMLERLGLVRVQLLDSPALFEGFAERRLDGAGQVDEFRFTGGDSTDRAHGGIGVLHPTFEACDRAFEPAAPGQHALNLVLWGSRVDS